MKAVVGLGNPAAAYEKTRHNLGFMVVDALLEEFGAPLKADTSAHLLKATILYKKEGSILCKPLTYMNLSGEAVAKLAQKNKLEAKDILVICDDIHLALGRIKIKPRGSSGGHKGLDSIIQSLKSEDFPRLRIGIAPEAKRQELSRYVLSEFSIKEKRVIQGSIVKARKAVLCWIVKGIENTMNEFNRAGE